MNYLVSGEEFYKLCKWSYCPRYENKFHFIINDVNNNDFVFLNLDYFSNFIEFLNKNNFNKKINLITHNSDLTFDEQKYELIKKYVNIIYPINCSIIKSNIIKIPIGFIDNRYKSHQQLIDIQNKNYYKNILIYLNFSIKTNEYERQKCYDAFKNKKFVYTEFNIKPIEYYLKLAKSKYVISPDGTGFDCHRIYESIFFNSIPIVKKNPLTDFYEKLPILLIDSWDDISQDFLEKKYFSLFIKLILWKSLNDWTKAKYWIK